MFGKILFFIMGLVLGVVFSSAVTNLVITLINRVLNLE